MPIYSSYSPTFNSSRMGSQTTQPSGDTLSRNASSLLSNWNGQFNPSNISSLISTLLQQLQQYSSRGNPSTGTNQGQPTTPTGTTTPEAETSLPTTNPTTPTTNPTTPTTSTTAPIIDSEVTTPAPTEPTAASAPSATSSLAATASATPASLLTTADTPLGTTARATPSAEPTAMSVLAAANTPSLPLSGAQTNILQSMFMSDNRGLPVAGNKLTVQDNGDGRLSVGDIVNVTNGTGAQVAQKNLTSTDVYDVLFRENMVKNINSIGNGWGFTDKLVAIRNSDLSRPYSRYSNGGWENVTGRNNYWEVVNRGGNNYLMMRQTDNAGNPVKASDALTDLFKNKQNYMFDCATPMTVLNLKSTLDTIGANDFNTRAGRLILSSWFDPYDTSRNDGGYIAKVRTAPANTITVNGVSNLAGETALFDTSLGDKLIPGGAYYFDKPGDVTSANQGWNAIYLGKTNSGYQFWSSALGPINVNFNNGTWIPSSGYNGYYLGGVMANTNTNRLQAWDLNRSI